MLQIKYLSIFHKNLFDKSCQVFFNISLKLKKLKKKSAFLKNLIFLINKLNSSFKLQLRLTDFGTD